MRRQEILDALQELENEQGDLTPTAVVEAARNPDNPLHKAFEWDDAKAAERDRLNTARSLLRIKVHYRVRNIPVRAPAYVHNPDVPGGQQGYRNVARIATQEDIAHAQLVDEFRRAGAALKRARGLAEIYSLGSEVEALQERLAGLSETINERTSAMT